MYPIQNSTFEKPALFLEQIEAKVASTEKDLQELYEIVKLIPKAKTGLGPKEDAPFIVVTLTPDQRKMLSRYISVPDFVEIPEAMIQKAVEEAHRKSAALQKEYETIDFKFKRKATPEQEEIVPHPVKKARNTSEELGFFKKLPLAIVNFIASKCDKTALRTLNILINNKEFLPESWANAKILRQAGIVDPSLYRKIDRNNPAKLDRDTIHAVVKQDPSLFFELPEAVQNIRFIRILAYLSMKRHVSSHPSEEKDIKKFLDFDQNLQNIDPKDDLKDRDVALAVLVLLSPNLAWENVSKISKLMKKFPNDREIVLEAVKKLGDALEFATPTFQADQEVVLEAVKQNGQALEFATPVLQANREVVLEAVKNLGDALEFAAPALRADREVVLEAVKQNGITLKFAAPRLQANREVVLEAVKQNGKALKYAAPALQADREVILEAMKQNAKALKYAPVDFDSWTTKKL